MPQLRIDPRALGVVALFLSTGCFVSAPTYALPSDESKAMVVPGFDSSKTQVGHWFCPLIEVPTKGGDIVTSPQYEVVLIEDAARGMILHELNNDWVMMKPEMKSDGASFSVALPGLFNEFIIPKDRTQDLTHNFGRVTGYYFIESEKLTRPCKAAPNAVRIL